MKRLMILGASILQLPAIIKAKELGLQVISVDIDKDAIGFKYADINLEISTIDIPKVVEAARQYEIDGVMTLASDMPMRTVAAVAKEMDIIGINEDTALKATNKALMRECLREHNVPIPAFFKADDYESYLFASNQLESRFIVKPADNSGSRGVFFVNCDNKNNLDYAYMYSKKYSRSGEIVVEEFMKGPEVSVETLSIDGEIHVIAITDKLTTGAPRFVEMGHSQPSQLSGDIINHIEAVAVKAVKAIGIENGPSHTEIIVTKEGPKIVELGARLGGDNITTHLVPLSTGIDMVRYCIEIALGRKLKLKNKYSMGSAIRYFNATPGRIDAIRGVEKASLLPGIKQISFVKNIGDIVGETNSSADRVGFVIAQAEDTEKAIKVCEDAIDEIVLCIK